MSAITGGLPALRVGVSALFDPADTPHARTFLRALYVARNFIPELAPLQWRFLDDGANAARGAEVARRMVEWGADLVIGHFSSDAALGAAAQYRQAGIALLTPAATHDRLTREHSNVFRFCPSDRQLAKDLSAWLRKRQWHRVHIEADDSAHGLALAHAIAEAVGRTGLSRVADRGQAQVEIFAGRLLPSRQHWRARRAEGSGCPLVLTDDAASTRLGGALAGDECSYVIGFGTPPAMTAVHPAHDRAQHLASFGSEPETYYRESLLMLHVLAQLAQGPLRGAPLLSALRGTRFDTPLGEVSFEQGELRGAFNQIWRIGPAGLMPVADQPATFNGITS